MTDILKEVVAEAVAESDAKTPYGLGSAVANKVADTPEYQNALSQEPWYQSRVANYGALGGLLAIFGLVQQAYSHGWALDQWSAIDAAQDIGFLWVTAGVIYGRFAPGLKPMWHRTFGGK